MPLRRTQSETGVAETFRITDFATDSGAILVALALRRTLVVTEKWRGRDAHPIRGTTNALVTTPCTRDRCCIERSTDGAAARGAARTALALRVALATLALGRCEFWSVEQANVGTYQTGFVGRRAVFVADASWCAKAGTRMTSGYAAESWRALGFATASAANGFETGLGRQRDGGRRVAVSARPDSEDCEDKESHTFLE